MKRLFIDGVTKRSRKVSEVNPRVSIDLEQYVRQVVASIGGSGGGSGSYTFDNGLTLTGSNVQLGGLLLDDTDINGDLGQHTLRFRDLESFGSETDNPLYNYTFHFMLNNGVPTNYALNGNSLLGLSCNKRNSPYGAGFFLTEDGLDQRPYIVSEMEYGGGAARTAKVEFSNDYILNSHKIYDTNNPNGVFREYLTRLGDNQLTIQSINSDSINPNDIVSNIVNTIEVSNNGIKFDSVSSTGTPLFSYTFPITSLSKPAPAQGHSMVLNSLGNQFDFVKDIKTLSYSIFDVSQTVVSKRIRLAVPFNKYKFESITVCQPNGGGTVDLKITKGSQLETVVINAANMVSNHVISSITNPVLNFEQIEIEITNITNVLMTGLSVTLNFLYAD